MRLRLLQSLLRLGIDNHLRAVENVVMTATTAAPQRIYRREPEWIRRAREHKLPAKVSGGRAA